MTSGRTSSNRFSPIVSRTVLGVFAVLTLYLVIAFPASATVDSGEIVPGSVTVSVGSTYDPINGLSVTFQWTTLHAGNSIVIIENSSDFNGNNNVPTRQIIQNDMTTNHVVVVDHFPAYTPYANWGFYVASLVGVPRCTVSTAICHIWATYPGPATGSGYYLSFAMNTMPNNPTGPFAFTQWPIGGLNVYQGDPTQSPACNPTSKSSRECNDLYIALQPNLLSGPSNYEVQMQNVVTTNLDTGQPVTDNSITAQYLCGLNMPSNPPPQGWDGSYSLSATCSNGTIYSTNTTLRLRVNSQAVPGHYQFAGNFQATYGGVNYGNPSVVNYNFTVLPTASFVPTPPTSFPTISNLQAWQDNMLNPVPYSGQGLPYRSAEWWCTNNTDTNPWWSLDNGNFVGWFDLLSSDYFEGWNYDGGRVYQQIADYSWNTRNLPDQGYHNDMQREHWKRCAQLAMEPYRDSVIATQGGSIREPNQFAYGMEMNYLRTGDMTNVTGIYDLIQAPGFANFFSGSVFAESVRLSAYMLDNELANELAGQQRDTAVVLRAVDVMLGYLDQSYNLNLQNPNQQEYDIHPFLLGTALEALIDYYDLDVAEGNTPDARLPLEIKKTLDWLETTQYVPQTHTFAYNAYDLPVNPTLVGGGLFDSTELNDLIAPAFAWYWYMSGNNTYLTEGDDLFNHVFDSAGGPGSLIGNGWTWSAKEYNQVYKWSFDYVRWRTGANPDGSQPPVDTVSVAANPCENQTSPCNAPWTDYTTPTQFVWLSTSDNGYPAILPNTVNAPTVTATTATFAFNVFKPNVTAVVFYGLNAPAACNLNNPQPPFCMQPFPNFGFLNMLNANYPNESDPGTEVQDTAALSLGINNIYDETVTVTGLTPNTTYHWRPLATDANGNMASFQDQTFTTAAQ